jgi:Na+-transporting methylmalonyl-CoA/oxaloacetate decarboxylase beta subunit
LIILEHKTCEQTEQILSLYVRFSYIVQGTPTNESHSGLEPILIFLKILASHVFRPLISPDKEEVMKACLQMTIKGIAFTRIVFLCVSSQLAVLCIRPMTDYDKCHKAISLFLDWALSSQK